LFGGILITSRAKRFTGGILANPYWELRLSFGAKIFHDALNQFFRFADLGGDDANIHYWNICVAIAVAIDAVLSDKYKRIGQ
jgi:hypothetical protein